MKRVRETEETSARPVPKVIYPGELLITVVVLLIVAALVWWGF